MYGKPRIGEAADLALRHSADQTLSVGSIVFRRSRPPYGSAHRADEIARLRGRVIRDCGTAQFSRRLRLPGLSWLPVQVPLPRAEFGGYQADLMRIRGSRGPQCGDPAAQCDCASGATFEKRWPAAAVPEARATGGFPDACGFLAARLGTTLASVALILALRPRMAGATSAARR
jgi:hypothetical protein